MLTGQEETAVDATSERDENAETEPDRPPPTQPAATLEGDPAAFMETRSSDMTGLVESSSSVWSGRSLGHFEIQERLGAGGMGSVWRARDVSLDREVALKLLPPKLTESPVLIARFVREARTQARLSHPNVVPIYFIGEEEGQHYFAMEVVEGESLDDRLQRREKTPWHEAVDIMLAVARGLKHARERGLIHRDIKPGNILICEDGTPKVADFGLAKPVEAIDDPHDGTVDPPRPGEMNLTAAGAFVGTPMYAPPEQVRGEQVDHHADIYSLGAAFFHVIAGEPVFVANSSVETMLKHANEQPDLGRLPPDVPDELRAIFARMLAKSPDDRFADYDELIAALEEVRPLEIVSASIGSRALAGVVDAFGSFLVVHILFLLVMEAGWLNPYTARMLDLSWAVIFAIYTGALNAFGLRTAGQLAAAHRLVSPLGIAPALGPLAIRTMILTIPLVVEFFSYPAALIICAAALLEGALRRDSCLIQDRLSGTRIVHSPR